MGLRNVCICGKKRILRKKSFKEDNLSIDVEKKIKFSEKNPLPSEYNSISGRNNLIGALYFN